MKRSSRPVALAALALTVAGVSGCTLTNQQTTQLQYTPGDGSQVRFDSVVVAQLVLVAADAESPGTLVGRVVNSGSEDVTITMTGTGDAVFDAEIDAPARDTLDIGPEGDEQVEVDPAGAGPGLMVPVTVATDAGETSEILVPVLDGTLEEFAELVPEASASAG